MPSSATRRPSTADPRSAARSPAVRPPARPSSSCRHRRGARPLPRARTVRGGSPRRRRSSRPSRRSTPGPPILGTPARGGLARGSPRRPPRPRPRWPLTLPKPTYTGGVARLQERHEIGGQWPIVRHDPRAGLHDVEARRPGHGPSIGSTRAMAGAVKTWSRTLSTGGSPSAARCVLSGSRYSASTRSASTFHSTRLSVSPGGNGFPGRGTGVDAATAARPA